MQSINQFKYLFVTTEHGKMSRTGGIGSYIEEIQNMAIIDVLVLVCAIDKVTPKSDRNWLVLNDFFEVPEIENSNFFTITAKAIQLIIETHHTVEAIEIQEFTGIGALLLHLQRNQLISNAIPIHMHCHGSARYIENNNQAAVWLHKTDGVYAEKVSIELTKNLRFPTDFLYKSYLRFNYNINPDKVYIHRYSFQYPDATTIEYTAIDTVIFFGKRNAMKGYKEFTEAIRFLTSNEIFSDQIKKIILLGPDAGYHVENEFFKNLSSRFIIEELSLPREQALAFIKTNASHSLCVLPYRGDNHPVSVLEVISCQCPLIAADAGGIPELIPAIYHKKLLFKPNAADLAHKVEEFLRYSTNEMERIVTSVFEEMKKAQIAINETQFSYFKNSLNIENPSIKTSAVAKYELVEMIPSLAFQDFISTIQALDCEFIILSKIIVADDIFKQIQTYISNNSLLDAGIGASNFLEYDVKEPILGDGLPALFLNKNYILSKILHVRKSKLLQILSGLDKLTIIDDYFLVKIIMLLKKNNISLGVVYLNVQDVVISEDIISNDSYKFLSLCNEIGLNQFDNDRIYKLLAVTSNYYTSSSKKKKPKTLLRIKHKLQHLFSFIKINNVAKKFII